MLDPSLLLFPLLLALLATGLGFPPLIGYLAAGFALYAAGVDALPFLQPIADLGVLLLLFAIGLKLDLRGLARAEIWGGASIHLALTMVITTSAIKLFSVMGIALFDELSLNQAVLLAFALGFSSTVFAIKMLEERGETQSLYGRTAIGILIMQDLFAVLYLTISKGALPSPWALLLLGLPLLRPLFYRLMDRVGHGEMLVLFGLAMALVPGAALFEAVGMKPDLGALVLGILLAGHVKASELSKSLFLFKELFLVAFFLTIGQQGLPTGAEVMTALALMLLLPIKLGLFLLLLARFRLRLRSALMASLSLGNFSEFGLIVLTAAIAAGSMDPSWLRVMALLVAFSFLLAAPMSTHGQNIYLRLRDQLRRLERHPLHPDDQPIRLGQPRVLIFGMGRIGSGAYDELKQHFGDTLLGIDHKQEIIERHEQAGRRVVMGDATDTDFWDKLEHSDSVELVILAMPAHQGNLFTAEQLARIEFQGRVAAISRWPEEAEALKEMGVHSVYNIYEAAGSGVAEQVVELVKKPA
ncbi:cation:proton antiporter [Ferrimonas balearica]|uniref:cation:proton antiporter n=1 Tax=Ferrimonas balearica TaxID=44012 RepID=UPI001F1AA953|nr:cation:proton antiporter family protein [Ferrimonas balearica]MBY6018646.1 cation:proton antiporter [Halomonas denitrificans]MBY6096402.1 cation:proton antiporter [Ferrimonas balearica]